MKKFLKGKEAGTITPLPPTSPPASNHSFGTPRLFDEYQARVASQAAESHRPLSYQAPSASSHHPRDSSDEARYSQSLLSASSSHRRRSQQLGGASPRKNRFPNQVRVADAYESYSDPNSHPPFRPSYERSNTSDYELRSPQPSHADRRLATKPQPSSGMAAPLPPRSLRPAQLPTNHRRDGSMSKGMAGFAENGAAGFHASHLPASHPSADSWARHRKSEDSEDSDHAAFDDADVPRSTAYPVYSGPESQDAGEVLISQGRYEETTLRELPKDKGKGMKLFGFSTGSGKDKKAKQQREDVPSPSPVPRISRDRDDAHLMSPPLDAASDTAHERTKEGGWMDRWKKGAHQYQAARLQDREAEELVASRIGWLSANAYDEQDWFHVLPIIDLVTQSEAASKEAARALRKEFKYGTVDTQRRAVRIWALLTLNGGDRFRVQVAGKRFLDSIEDTIASSKTPLSVKETMLRVLGVLAFEFRENGELVAVTKCWNKVKPRDRPKDGEPLVEDLSEFRLPQSSVVQQQQQERGTWRRASQRYSKQPSPNPEVLGVFSPPQQPPPSTTEAAPLHRHSAAFSRTHKPQPQPPWPSHTDHNASSTPDIVSNLEAAAASMDSRSASFPGSLSSSHHSIIGFDDDVRRLHEECQIARSNAAVLLDTLLHEGLHAETAELIDEFYAKVVRSQEVIASQLAWASAQTNGEGLLADLLEAHGRTSEAVRCTDEARRVKEEEEEERRVTERSKVEVRLDRSAVLQDGVSGEVYEARAGLLGVEASGSRSPSPNALKSVASPASGFSNTSNVISPPLPARGLRISRPLPVPRSDQSSDSNTAKTSIHSTHSTASSHHSRDTSLTNLHTGAGGGRSPLPLTPTLNLDTRRKAEEEEDELQTPVVPSAKALGKRRAVSVRYASPPPGASEAVPPLPGKNVVAGMGGLRLGD